MKLVAETPQAKILKGTFRPDRHAKPPVVPIGAPKPPTWLPKEAKRYWKQIAPRLAEAGLLSLVDTAAFTAHCDSVAKFQEACQKLKTLEDCIDLTPQNFQVHSALFTIRNKLWDQVMRSAKMFGVTPTGRGSRPTGDLKPKDEWDDL